MKKIILSLFVLTCLSVVKTQAQMEAARKVQWDLEKDVEVNMEMDTVWGIFSDNNLLKKASDGYVTGIEIIDANFPMSRKITFSNGSSRLENIKQNEPHNKLIVIDFSDTALPNGIKSAEYAIFIKAKGDKTSIAWRALVKGNEEAKKALIEQLKKEFDSYAAGLNKMTRKAIPMIKMN